MYMWTFAITALNYGLPTGIVVFEKPCGVVVGVRELFGSESKSQVYGHLHTLFFKGKLGNVGKKMLMRNIMCFWYIW